MNLNDSHADRGGSLLSLGCEFSEPSVASHRRSLNRLMPLLPTMPPLRLLPSILVRFVLTIVAAGQIGYALPVTLHSCSVPGVKRRARCGAIEVQEDPDRPGSRKLEIHFAVIPPASGHARPDPIVPLLGGPGESAIESGQYFVERLGQMLNDRDLLLVDQRGTGQSNALRCHFFSSDNPAESLQYLFPPARVEGCAKELAAHAELTQYSYQRFADDLEKVRQTLGYGRLNLFAGSYGTRAAQVFVRAYPSSVRTTYLGSVVPIDIAMPLPFAKAEQSMLERTLDACESDASCHSAFPHLRDEFSQSRTNLHQVASLSKFPVMQGRWHCPKAVSPNGFVRCYTGRRVRRACLGYLIKRVKAIGARL